MKYNYELLCFYLKGMNLVFDKDGIMDLFKLKYFLDCYGDKEFGALFKGDLNNRITEDINTQAIKKYCKKKIDELLSISQERETIIKKLLNNFELQYLILQSFHDGNIIEVTKEKEDLILYIDNESAMSEVCKCKIRFKCHEIVTENIVNIDLNKHKYLSSIKKGCISSTNFTINNNQTYYSFFFFNGDICTIKFDDISFDEKIKFANEEILDNSIVLTKDKSE